MPRAIPQGRSAKRKLSKTDTDHSDQEEQLNRAYTADDGEVASREGEVRLSETRHETTPKPSTNFIHRQKIRKRRYVDKTVPPFKSEYVEIEYVNQLRHNFSPKNGLAGDLPPIHDLKQIFEQITLHAVHKDGFREFLKVLKGRELRVATVCSGTESPILALEMVVSREFPNRNLI